MLSASILPGLPPYGPPAHSYPLEWGCLGREGTVVEVKPETGPGRIFNLAPGGTSTTCVLTVRDGSVVLAISKGAAYLIQGPPAFQVEEIASAISSVHGDPTGEPLLLEDCYTRFLGLFANGTWWRTRQLSWDGFTDVRVSGTTLVGFALDPTDHKDRPKPFRVDIRTGRSEGGSFLADNPSTIERLLPDAS